MTGDQGLILRREVPHVEPEQPRYHKSVLLPNAGHAANLDNPEAFNRVLLEFLDSLPPAP